MLMMIPLFALGHLGITVLRKNGFRKAVLLGVAYVHLLTVMGDPLLNMIGTILRIPVLILAVLQTLTIPPAKVKIKELPLAFRSYMAGLVIFLLIATASLIWTVNIVDTLVKSAIFSLLTLFLYLSFTRRWIKNWEAALDDIRTIIGAVALFFLVSAVLTVPSIIEAINGGTRYQGITHNPNTIAALAAVSFYPSLVQFFHYRKNYMLFYPLLFVVALFLSGSRTSSSALVISALIVLVAALATKANFLNRLLPVLISGAYITLIILLWLSTRPAETLESLVPRQFDFEVSSSFFNGREQLWGIGIILAEDRPYFGYGFNGTRTALSNIIASGEFSGQGAQLHSSYIEVLVDLGIVGAFVFLLVIIILLIKIVQQSSYYPLLGASVLTPLFLAISESALFGLGSLVAIMFWILCTILFACPPVAPGAQLRLPANRGQIVKQHSR